MLQALTMWLLTFGVSQSLRSPWLGSVPGQLLPNTHPCWPAVYDVVPTLKQHWVYVSFSWDETILGEQIRWCGLFVLIRHGMCIRPGAGGRHSTHLRRPSVNHPAAYRLPTGWQRPHHLIMMLLQRLLIPAEQRQTAVTAHFASEQLLLFPFAFACWLSRGL